MTNKIKILSFAAVVLAILLLVFIHVFLLLKKENPSATKNKNNYELTTNPLTNKILSEKCGYEHFYQKKSDGKLIPILKVKNLSRKDSPVEGMSKPAFDQSISTWDSVSQKIIEPEARIHTLIYTDACAYGTSTPIYYYKNGQEKSVVKNEENDYPPVTEIIKGKTFEDVESFIFNNPTAKLMECTLRSWIGSAESLLSSRIISYTPETVTGQARMLSEDQKNYVIKQGGQVAPAQEEGLYVETTVSYTDTGGYVSRNDCGDNMYNRTRFYESIDIHNVLIRQEKPSEIGFWNSIDIVK